MQRNNNNPLVNYILLPLILIFIGYVVFSKVNFTTILFHDNTPPAAPSPAENQQQPNRIDQTGAKLMVNPTNNPALPYPQGTIFRFVKDDGLIVMVTDLEKVPMQYRGSMKVLLPGEPINQGAAAAGQYVTSQSQQQSDPRVTPIEVVNSLVFVPVTLTYQGRTVTTRLLLDTGATGVTISPAIAQRLGAYSGSPMTITLADGRKVMSFQFACEQVSVGLKTKINSRVCVMPRDDSEEVGLLGMEFLSEFSHSIDTKAKVIRWL